MQRDTIDIYERRGQEWAALARPTRSGDAERFAASAPAGRPIVDLGCGAGRYLTQLGRRAIGLDAARAMLRQARASTPGAALVQADLEALPFGRATLHGAWANMSYLHVPRARMPLALAELHRATAVGAEVDVQLLGGAYEGDDLPNDRIGGRFFAGWTVGPLGDVLVGAGFEVTDIVDKTAAPDAAGDDDLVWARARRQRTLPDTVGPGMRLLVCGLNPSVYAADAGVGFARAGNRFWPAALAAGLVTRDRNPWDALRSHGIGMTDLVKRATPSASALTASEYADGMGRLERLARWLQPGAVCFVGLAGWRAARTADAVAGEQTLTIGGRPVYLMGSTSGANAHDTVAGATERLRRAAALADANRADGDRAGAGPSQ